MKITDVKTILLSHLYPREMRLKWAGGEVKAWDAALIQIFTDEGITGLGEVCFGLFFGEPIAALVEHFKRQIIGEDPFQVGRLWEKMYQTSIYWGRHGLAVGVIAGIDIALYDIVGKATKLPVYQLLGGLTKNRLKTYGSGGASDSVAYLTAEAEKIAGRGFDSYKLRMVSPKDAPTIMDALRKTLGPDFHFMVDGVQGSVPNPWSFAEAVELAETLQEYNVSWLEEPLRIENKQGYAALRRKVRVPLSGGEVITEALEFKHFFDLEALDYAQPDVTIAGGFTGCKRIAALASCYSVPLALHVWGTGVSLMANLHFGLATSNCFIAEYCQMENPLRDGLLIQPLEIQAGGYVDPPLLPGLGVQITDDFIAKYSYRLTGGTQMIYSEVR